MPNEIKKSYSFFMQAKKRLLATGLTEEGVLRISASKTVIEHIMGGTTLPNDMSVHDLTGIIKRSLDDIIISLQAIVKNEIKKFQTEYNAAMDPKEQQQAIKNFIETLKKAYLEIPISERPQFKKEISKLCSKEFAEVVNESLTLIEKIHDLNKTINDYERQYNEQKNDKRKDQIREEIDRYIKRLNEKTIRLDQLARIATASPQSNKGHHNRPAAMAKSYASAVGKKIVKIARMTKDSVAKKKPNIN